MFDMIYFIYIIVEVVNNDNGEIMKLVDIFIKYV